MLICFDKAERHLPDRCLRQYGMHQPIPEDVLRWERKSRGVDGGIDLSGKMESELSEWSDRRLHIVEGDEDVDDSEYMQWYLGITRKLVGRPIPISSEFQRMVNLCLDLFSSTTSFHILGPGLGIPTFEGDITDISNGYHWKVTNFTKLLQCWDLPRKDQEYGTDLEHAKSLQL